MSDLDLNAIGERVRVVQATPGPWVVGERTLTNDVDTWRLPVGRPVRFENGGADLDEVCAVAYETGGFHFPHAEARAEAEFIAHARTDVPALFAEVERLRYIVLLVTELTRDTDGDSLDPDEDIPVGEVMRALAGESA